MDDDSIDEVLSANPECLMIWDEAAHTFKALETIADEQACGSVDAAGGSDVHVLDGDGVKTEPAADDGANVVRVANIACDDRIENTWGVGKCSPV